MKFLFLLLPSLLLASPKQCRTQVFNIAKRFTPYPSTIVAIAQTESSCGVHLLGDDAKSLGPLQIQVPTARDVIRWNPKRLGHLANLPDQRLQTLLLTNIYVSTQIASLLFEHHRKIGGYEYAVRKYNGYIKGYLKYYNKVQHNKHLYTYKKL